MRETHHVRRLVLAWLALFAIYATTASSEWHSTDVVSAELGSWRIATTGQPWVDGLSGQDWYLRVESEGSRADAFSLFSTRNAENDHAVITRTPGVIAAAVPAYLVASVVVPSSANALSPVPGALFAAALTATTVLLVYLALSGLVSPRLRVGAAAALGLATPAWSVAADGMWTHTLTIFGIAGMAWACRRERWWLVGLFGGIGLWGRLHVALIVALLGLGLAIWRRRPAIALKIALTSVPFLGALFLWGHWHYGVWDLTAATGGYARYATPAEVQARFATDQYASNLAGYLVAPGGGILVWTPVLLVLIPSAIRSWRTTPDWVRVLVVAGFCYLLAQASINRFTGGVGFWGNRLGLETLMCLVPVAAIAAAGMGTRVRALCLVVLTYQTGVIALGSILNLALTKGSGWDEYDPLTAFQDNPVATVLGIAIGAIGCLTLARLLRALPDDIRRDQLSAEPST